MALTLDAEQKLQATGLVALYQQHEQEWVASARETKAFLVGNFPKGSTVRMDDVAKALHPIMEVNDKLVAHRDSNKLRQKYWVRYFVDLIIDRAWPQI